MLKKTYIKYIWIVVNRVIRVQHLLQTSSNLRMIHIPDHKLLSTTEISASFVSQIQVRRFILILVWTEARNSLTFFNKSGSYKKPLHELLPKENFQLRGNVHGCCFFYCMLMISPLWNYTFKFPCKLLCEEVATLIASTLESHECTNGTPLLFGFFL